MRRPPRDASALAALVKFDNALSKRFEKQLEDFNESEYRQLQSLQELFKFLDEIMPLDEDEDGDEEEEASAAKKRAARKRRSESVTSDATSIPDEWTAKPSRGKGGKAKSKCGHQLHLKGCTHYCPSRRRQTSQSDEDEDEEIGWKVLLPTRCPLDRCHAGLRKEG
jgi:condensin complex subunit 3